MRGGRHGPQHRALPTQPHTKADAAEGAGRVTIIFREAIGGDDGAMAAVQVVALVQPGAHLEIEATAIVPDPQ